MVADCFSAILAICDSCWLFQCYPSGPWWLLIVSVLSWQSVMVADCFSAILSVHDWCWLFRCYPISSWLMLIVSVLSWRSVMIADCFSSILLVYDWCWLFQRYPGFTGVEGAAELAGQGGLHAVRAGVHCDGDSLTQGAGSGQHRPAQGHGGWTRCVQNCSQAPNVHFDPACLLFGKLVWRGVVSKEVLLGSCQSSAPSS